MTKKLLRLSKIIALTLLALWGLIDGPDLVSSKTVTTSQQVYRDAKARQDVDRRATEIRRQQILADSAAKFDEQQRTYGNNYGVNYGYSWNQRYRNFASTRNYQNGQQFNRLNQNGQQYNRVNQNQQQINRLNQNQQQIN